MQTIVIGHKNPDMDAIVSAIAYAELKRAMGWDNVVAARAGSLNERICFALHKFGVPEPVFFSDVSPRIEDVMERRVVHLRDSDPVERALDLMAEKKFRALPVVDSSGKLAGMVSSFRVTNYLFPRAAARAKAREVEASLKDIAATFGGESLTGPLDDEPRPYTLVVAAMGPETFSERLAQMEHPERIVLFVGDRGNIIEQAILRGVRAIVLTSGLHTPEHLAGLARERGVHLLESPFDTATSVLLSRSAMQVRLLLDESCKPLPPEMPLEEARRELALSSDFAFPVVDDERRLVGILSKSDFLRPVPRQLILVDHNELSQAVNGARDIPIIEILDHHRISTIITEAPILFMNRPVGSTSTIVAQCYEQAGVPIPRPIAGLLMCGLISDTLNLTSPTTTEVDRYVMKQLESITRIAPASLASEIFSVGSPLLTMSPEDAITADCKPYQDKGVSFSIAQVEELTFSHFWEKAPGLLEALENFRQANGHYFSALLVTDVNTQNSILLARGAPAFLRLIDYPEIEPFMWRLEGVVSRKKQLLPYLTALLSRAVA